MELAQDDHPFHIEQPLLGYRIPLPCGLTIPFARFELILRNTIADSVCLPQETLSAYMLLLGSSQSPCNSSGGALFNASSIQVKNRKLKLSASVPLFCCLIEPMGCS
jgi:hypothetical protein